MGDRTVDVAQKAETAAELQDIFRAEAGADGFVRRLDDRHWAGFVARGRTLLVTFERVEATLARGETGLPLGLDFVEDKNWSLLHVATEADSWYRAAAVYAFFDDLVDDAFFEEFDRVVFYGAGMGGYAAAAYSVVAPGAAVLVLAPQATLDRERTLWERRFPAARQLEFERRYGYAPDMLEGADRAYVLFDPHEQADTVHATLFRGPNVMRLKCWHLRERIETSLEAMELLHPLIEAVANGTLTPAMHYRLMRARRQHSTYLRNLVFHMDEDQSPLRIALLCVHVLASRNAPAFRRRLSAAKQAIAEDGPLPDWLADA